MILHHPCWKLTNSAAVLQLQADYLQLIAMTEVEKTLTILKRKRPNTLTQAELIMLRLGNTMTAEKMASLMKTSQQERDNTARYIARLKEERNWSDPVIIDGIEYQFEISEQLAEKRGYNPAILH